MEPPAHRRSSEDQLPLVDVQDEALPIARERRTGSGSGTGRWEDVMMRGLGWLLILTAAPVCWSQGILEQVNLRSMSLGGFHLYGVSVFSGYSTSAYPQGGLG